MEKRKCGKTLWRCSSYTKGCRVRISSHGKTIKISHDDHNHQATVKGVNNTVPYQVVNVVRFKPNSGGVVMPKICEIIPHFIADLTAD